MTQPGQIKELFHLFYPLTLTYPKKKFKMGVRLPGWEYDQLQHQEEVLLLKTDGSYVIKYMLLQTPLQVMPMIFTEQWQKKVFSVFAFFICMNTQLTFIHTGGKKNYDGCHGSVRIRADWFTSWLLNILWSHDVRTASYIIKRVS